MLILLISVCLAQESSRLIHPTVGLIEDTIEETQYTIGENYTLILYYPGVYGMQLNKQSIGSNYTAQESIYTLDPFTLPGCWSYQRRLLHKAIFEVTPDDKFPKEENETSGLFTSMFTLSNHIFIIRSDYMLFQFTIENDLIDRTITGISPMVKLPLTSYLNATNALTQEQTIVCSEQHNYCYIFSQAGIVVFHVGNDGYIDSMKKLDNINNQEYPQSVYIDQKLSQVYICYGSQGLDAYAIVEDGQLILQKQIPADEGSNYVQSKTNNEGTILYVLDSSQGILIYEMESTKEYQRNSLQIQIYNGKSFDFYGNTFIILAETQDNRPYALEVFLDYENEHYYFNRIYMKDDEVFDVYVGEYYAILIGARYHRVIYHSIYNKFTNTTNNDLFFYDNDLVDVESYHPFTSTTYNQGAFDTEPLSKVAMSYQQSFMIGLSDNEINIFAIKNLPPWVQCKASEPKKAVYIDNKQHYQLLMNSTKCQAKISRNLESPFTQCLITHEFTFEGRKLYLTEGDLPTAIIIGVSVAGFICLLMVVALCCHRRLKAFNYNRQMKLINMSKELGVNLKFEEFEDMEQIVQAHHPG